MLEGIELIKFKNGIIGPLNARIDQLEKEVRELRAELRRLKLDRPGTSPKLR